MFIFNCKLHRAAIFDLDGTLLDSMWVWHAVDREFFAARGMDVPADYAEKIQSLTFRETAVYTVERFGLPESPEDLMALWNEMSFQQYRDHVKLKPGAKEYLASLRSRGVKLGVATNLTAHVARAVLESNGVLGWFDALTSADEVPRGKSFPDIWLLAARKLGVEPRLCVAYDDVAKALLGIRAAGMTACAVREPDMPQDWEGMKREFDCYIEDFVDILLPPALRAAPLANEGGLGLAIKRKAYQTHPTKAPFARRLPQETHARGGGPQGRGEQ